ncbi:MAG: sulfatase-like hydrolase/transferase [Planctomycetota bacterium]
MSWRGWLVVALSAMAIACSKEERPPNVLIITIDTLRADRVGCYGSDSGATPHLDALAARGVRIEQAFTAAPITLPSHASILTGAYPTRHGVRMNGTDRLDDRLPTLAERLARTGYRTGAFVSAYVVTRPFGLGRGFDHYDDAVGTELERDAGATRQAFEAWSDQATERPFFAWVHFFDPHLPRRAPDDLAKRFSDGYDAEIASVDREIGRLFDWLEERGELERTLVVVTSDHGEGLGEHGEMTHFFFIYDSTMRVPMLFAGPGVPKGKVLDRGVGRTIDIAPTVLDALDLSVPETMQGRPLWKTIREGGRLPEAAYLESFAPRLSMGWSELRGLRTDRDKLIEAPTPELYDTSEDPGELENLATERTERLEAMRRALPQESGPDVMEVQTGAADQTVLENLNRLGYLGGKAPPPSGRDPKDLIELLDPILRVESTLLNGRPDEIRSLAEKLDALLPKDPTNPKLLDHLGRLWGALGECDKGLRLLDLARRASPQDAEIEIHLGEVARRCGQLPKALEAFERAAGLPPHDGRAWVRLGRVLTEMGRQPDAAKAYTRAVEDSDDAAEILLEAGTGLFNLGRALQAEAMLRKAANKLPNDPDVWERLARACEANGAPERAAEAQRRLEALRR